MRSLRQRVLCMRQVAGLWQGPSALSQDFGIVLYRIQLLGFNAIRLPFSFQASPPPLYTLNPSIQRPTLSQDSRTAQPHMCCL